MKKSHNTRQLVLMFLFCSCIAGFTACSTEDEADEIIKMPEVLDGHIREDMVWKNINANPSHPDYTISEDIRVSAKLTIEPGVVIAFKAGTALTIEETGTLIARGTPESKIIFTGEEKITGFWRGISIQSSDVRNEMDHVEVSYAGGSPVDGWLNEKSNIGLVSLSIFTGRLKFTNSISSHSGGSGMLVQDGAELNGFANNQFIANQTTPLILPASQVGNLDTESKYSGGNGKDFVQISASTLKTPLESRWPAPADGTHYLVAGDIKIQSGLRIQEGAVFEFGSDKAMIIGHEGGYLIARGTAAKNIVFTAENRLQPSWRGLLFFSGNTLNEMDYTEVSYAGSITIDGWVNDKANISLAQNSLWSAYLKLTHSRITNGGGWGIVVQDAATLKTDGTNIMEANAFGNMR